LSDRRFTAREAALQALYRVERDGAFLNLVMPPLLKKLPPPERALARELASGTIRRCNTLDWTLGLFLKRPLGELTAWMRNLLRLAAYQLLRR
jgi:16S rRNA (cytosine967-C5)-methyltransferase